MIYFIIPTQAFANLFEPSARLEELGVVLWWVLEKDPSDNPYPARTVVGPTSPSFRCVRFTTSRQLPSVQAQLDHLEGDSPAYNGPDLVWIWTGSSRA